MTASGDQLWPNRPMMGHGGPMMDQRGPMMDRRGPIMVQIGPRMDHRGPLTHFQKMKHLNLESGPMIHSPKIRGEFYTNVIFARNGTCNTMVKQLNCFGERKNIRNEGWPCWKDHHFCSRCAPNPPS